MALTLKNKKKSQKSDSKKSTTQQKQTKKDKEKTSLMRQLQSKYDIARFFIDENNELLYKVDHTGRETLCVPQITRDHEETLRYMCVQGFPLILKRGGPYEPHGIDLLRGHF